MLNKSERFQNVGLFGFTVPELVAVIAVISILVVLLLPGLRNAREMGRSGKCVSNLKQLVQAVRMYVDDDPQGRLPGWSAGQGPWDKFELLMPLLFNYFNASSSQYEIFQCPSNRADLNNFLQCYDTDDDTLPCSYPIHYEYSGSLSADGNQVAQRRIANPEWVAVLYDWPVDPAAPETNVHRGGCNIAFYDGHVKWYSRAQMSEHHAPKVSTPATQYDTWGLN